LLPPEKGSVHDTRQEVTVGSDEHYFNSREFSRGAVSIPAEIREKGAGRQRVSVIDLSRSGFRMHCIFLIPEDRTVFLTMEGFESMEARIAWHDDDYYGCEFKQRLHEAVYDHVIKAYPLLRQRR
jgi:PilZ domain